MVPGFAKFAVVRIVDGERQSVQGHAKELLGVVRKGLRIADTNSCRVAVLRWGLLGANCWQFANNQYMCTVIYLYKWLSRDRIDPAWLTHAKLSQDFSRYTPAAN